MHLLTHVSVLKMHLRSSNSNVEHKETKHFPDFQRLPPSLGMCDTDMWNRASFVTRLVASSVRISEAAGSIIKNVMADGDLKIVDKSVQGEPEDLQTEADRRAQFLIVKSLTERFGNINIIGEEEVTSECSTVENSFAAEVLQIEKDVNPELREVKPNEIAFASMLSYG